jgi:hypothetical protein
MPGGRYYADALRRRLARLEAEGDTEKAAVTAERLQAAEAAEAEDLSKLPKAELVDRAEKAGVDSSGTKAEIVAALEKAGG